MEHELKPTQHIREVLKKTLETLEPVPQPPTTPLLLNEKARKWLDKWLLLNTRNQPKLLQLEAAVYEFCRAYSKRPSVGKRLVITGPNGVGKTHCAKAIHRWAIRTALLLPLVHVSTEDGEDIQISTAQYLFWPGIVDGFKRDEWDIVEEACKQSLVILDDVGAEHDPSGIGREKLYYILERRAQRWTVITTNVPADQWDIRFESRVASRFLRNCVVVQLDGIPDYGSL